MRFSKFLNSSFNDEIKDLIDNNKHLIKEIQKKCSDILRIYKRKKNYFFRGAKFNNQVVKLKPLKNRKPRDTPLMIHYFLDDYLFNKFRWRVRSNGVFAYNDRISATIYGNIYLFFPKNEFKYVYNPDVHDITSTVLGYYIKIENTTLLKDNTQLTDEIKKHLINDVLSGFKDTGLESMLASKKVCEFIFSCDYYYLIDVRTIIDIPTLIDEIIKL